MIQAPSYKLNGIWIGDGTFYVYCTIVWCDTSTGTVVREDTYVLPGYVYQCNAMQCERIWIQVLLLKSSYFEFAVGWWSSTRTLEFLPFKNATKIPWKDKTFIADIHSWILFWIFLRYFCTPFAGYCRPLDRNLSERSVTLTAFLSRPYVYLVST